MHPNSLFSIRHWTLPEILFVAAACFAIGAVGFFLAVYLQLSSVGNTQDSSMSGRGTMADKERVLQALAGSDQSSNVSSGSVSESQASPTDPLAAQKLKMLEELNTQ